MRPSRSSASPPLHPPTWRRLGTALAVVAALATSATAGPLPHSGTQVLAYTLKHQSTADALAVVRPLLSRRGTVEEQPADHTLVLRDAPETVRSIVAALDAFDVPPEGVRFAIQLVRAGVAGPPRSAAAPPRVELPPDLVERLRGLLRYEAYEVLASAALTAREGEEVVYSLGKTYSVSFLPGSAAGDRLKLEGFRILQHPPNPTNKGRRLPPRQLFHATLNVQLERLFTLVIAAPPGAAGPGEEALLVAIHCVREPAPGEAAAGEERPR